MQQVTRLLQLYDSLLKMREWEQKQSAEVWQSAKQELRIINDMIQEAEATSIAHSLTGEDAMMWDLYLGYLEDKQKNQHELVEVTRSAFEVCREQTLLAYQEKEKWRLQSARMESELMREIATREIKSADDMAIQRYGENAQHLFEEVEKSGKIYRR